MFQLHFVSYKEAYLNDDGSLNVTLVGDSNDLGAALGFFIEVSDIAQNIQQMCWFNS